MKWIDALKIYNAGKMWCVPRKGTPEYDEVRRIMSGGKKTEAPTATTSMTPDKMSEPKKMIKPRLVRDEAREAKKAKVKKFLMTALAKRKAKKEVERMRTAREEEEEDDETTDDEEDYTERPDSEKVARLRKSAERLGNWLFNLAKRDFEDFKQSTPKATEMFRSTLAYTKIGLMAKSSIHEETRKQWNAVSEPFIGHEITLDTKKRGVRAKCEYKIFKDGLIVSIPIPHTAPKSEIDDLLERCFFNLSSVEDRRFRIMPLPLSDLLIYDTTPSSAKVKPETAGKIENYTDGKTSAGRTTIFSTLGATYDVEKLKEWMKKNLVLSERVIIENWFDKPKVLLSDPKTGKKVVLAQDLESLWL